MQQALHWCSINESMSNDYLKAYYESYLYEKDGYVHVLYPSMNDFEKLSVLDQRSLLEKWQGLEDAINFELRYEKIDFEASTMALNCTRGSIYSTVSTNAFYMVDHVRRLTYKSYYEHVAVANVIMKRVRPENYEVTTAKIIAELQYWYASATCFVERPLTKGYAQRAQDSSWQYEELKQFLVSNHILAFLCGTCNGSMSLVKLLHKELLSMIMSFLVLVM
jgi:predicted AlkP superfamily pyrophosphatase or phosphodiesterase